MVNRRGVVGGDGGSDWGNGVADNRKIYREFSFLSGAGSRRFGLGNTCSLKFCNFAHVPLLFGVKFTA